MGAVRCHISLISAQLAYKYYEEIKPFMHEGIRSFNGSFYFVGVDSYQLFTPVKCFAHEWLLNLWLVARYV